MKASRNRDPGTRHADESPLSALPAAMDTAVLEHRSGREFRLLAPPPDWFTAFFPGSAPGRMEDPLTRLPFLDVFFNEAVEGWAEGKSGPFRSDTWSEVDSAGAEHQLEATALLVGGRQVLLVERLGEEYEERQSVIQKAREGKLSAQRRIAEEQRTSEDLRERRDELEERVRERTRELTAANARLQQEVAERRQAAERLIQHQQELRSLARELSRAEEQERRRIATVLHDQIGQSLAVAKMRLGSLHASLDDRETAGSLDEVYALLDEVIQSTRRLTFELGSPVLYELGLEAALESLAEEVQERHGIATRFESDGRPKPLADEIRVVLFQAVRELFFNVVKHARAGNASIEVRRGAGEILIRVTDDGVGFDSTGIGPSSSTDSGFGLFNIRERLDQLGGRMEISSTRGEGARVDLLAPLELEPESAPADS